MSRYKGIIFDLDGTLLDTIEDIGDSMNEVLERFNLPTHSYEEYKKKVGGGFRRLVLKNFPKETDEETINNAVDILFKVYDRRYLNKTRPYNGINDLLDSLVEKDIKLAVNSNKKDEYTKNLIDKFFKRIPFVKVYGEREDVDHKPDPTTALEIAESMGLKLDEILFIGDSNVDIMTAKNAHMDSVGVLWGFRNREELEKYGANYIVSNWKEIVDIVE
ncbi:HAD family hydrolase [Anaerosalibacter massiliensis]|uniref:HAD family hydrolase n=1 Tax=Anaerosalibacter massiliensis TaxID=1347392 RepID=A0A9X2ML58_9FIRM|nr:HAD family hydrolase [Anaerosalibacter massiliensis]MCR2045162.1 HAD family hydrolase [Anaerosalibacter massiliensis]